MLTVVNQMVSKFTPGESEHLFRGSAAHFQEIQHLVCLHDKVF